MIKIELQHFYGCPNSEEMIKHVKEAITRLEVEVEYKEVLVDTPEKAEIHKFRGSPTVLVNGSDLEGLPEPDAGNLSCRYYKNGLPSVEKIMKAVKKSKMKER